MKTGKQKIFRAFSMMLAASLLAGCSKINGVYEKAAQYMEINQTISKDSKWLNSDLAGVVTADTSVSEKDDFAAAANKDWILSVADQVEEKESISVIEENYDVIVQQKKALLDQAIAGTGFGENQVGMDQADYDHMCDEFTKIVSAAADWNGRNAAGVKPLEKYISAIDSIHSLDQMSEYLCGQNAGFMSNGYLIPFVVGTSLDETKERYVVNLTSLFDNSLDAGDGSSSLHQAYVMETVTGILKQLGYSPSEAERIVKQCWQVEMKLSESTAYAEIVTTITSEDGIKKQFNNVYTAEELEDLSGDYPIMDILKAYNYDQSEEYVVYEPDYVRGVAKLYKESNLEKIKSYYMVHTVLWALPLLTRDYYDQYEAYFTDTAKNDKDSEEDDTKKEEESENKLSKEDQILQKFTKDHLNGIFEEMYAANYCSSEQKAYVTDLIKEAIAEYEKMLADEDWMSEETRKKAIEKLNAITARVLYPDQLNGCSELQAEAGDLLDITAKLNVYNRKKEAAKINTAVDKKEWDLNNMPTTAVNAYYSSSDNSITILSGIVADGQLLDIHASDEENMAHLGYIIGHEISHAFDTSGYLYDKDGNLNKWWTDQDEEAFQNRVSKLANYYSTFKCFRNATENIKGERIQGEAIADMGGMKCMLAISKQKEDFDYQKFFRAFARTWATSRNYSVEMQVVSQDVHPLPFLRINVTVQQFEEFYKAFDVQPGDGMYLAPEKRIAVW